MESVDHHYHPHSVSFYRGANWHFQGGQPLSQGPSAEWALEPEILASHLMAFLPPHRLPLKAKGCDRNWQSFRHPASNHRCTSLPRTKQPELPKAGACSGGHLLSPEPAHAQVHGQAVSEPQEWPHPCADLLCWPLILPIPSGRCCSLARLGPATVGTRKGKKAPVRFLLFLIFLLLGFLCSLPSPFQTNSQEKAREWQSFSPEFVF